MSIALTKISETSSKITLGWTPVPGCIGYVFFADGTRVSNTWDPNKSQVTFSKGPSVFKVTAVGVKDEGVYPPVAPPTGTLKWRPPGWNGGDPTKATSFPGYEVRTITGPGTINLDDSKDYYLDMGDVAWSSQSGNSAITIQGGRNVVLIGGRINMTSTNSTDDSRAILISDGADAGIVHIEGIDIACCNGPTVRTRRDVRIQNCRITVSAFNDQHGNIHPDIVQVWGTNRNTNGHTPCKAIRMHKVTGLTTYTGLSVLVEIAPPNGQIVNPVLWERYETNIRPKQNLNGTLDAGNYAYMCDSPTGNAGGPYTEYLGEVHCRLPTGGGGAYTRGMDDICVLRAFTGGGGYINFPYEIKNPAGTNVFVSALSPTGGSGLGLARTPGNYLTYDRVPKFVGHKFIVVDSTFPDFCPAGVPGVNYVSPLYQ